MPLLTTQRNRFWDNCGLGNLRYVLWSKALGKRREARREARRQATETRPGAPETPGQITASARGGIKQIDDTHSKFHIDRSM